MFFCEFCGNTFFIEDLRAAVSENRLLVDEAHLCISDSESETKKFSPIFGLPLLSKIKRNFFLNIVFVLLYTVCLFFDVRNVL